MAESYEKPDFSPILTSFRPSLRSWARTVAISFTPQRKWVSFASVAQSLPACPNPLQYGHRYFSSLSSSTNTIAAASGLPEFPSIGWSDAALIFALNCQAMCVGPQCRILIGDYNEHLRSENFITRDGVLGFWGDRKSVV